MYTNTGYRNLNDEQLEDYEVSLRINCCGVYRLLTLPVMVTNRPFGRPDYQILYIAAGKATFQLGNELREVPAGNIVLYLPHQCQHYSYCLADKPEVYWLHITGKEVHGLLGRAGFSENPVVYTGISPRYQDIFLSIIREIQLPRSCSEELSTLFLRQLFLYLERFHREGGNKKSGIRNDMEQAVHDFHENFTEDIQMEAYAKKLHMSTCWFIRSFKQYTGLPPRQYLTSIRIQKAKELLESTNYGIGQIGQIIGYENPLYFSRIFKKYTGLSPAEYRKSQL